MKRILRILSNETSLAKLYEHSLFIYICR